MPENVAVQRTMIQLSDDQIKQISEQCEPEDLPGDLSEVAELVGTYKALLLGYHIGCGRIYIKPWSDDQDSWSKDIRLMVDAIGEVDAQKVVANFSPFNTGTHVDIPRCDRFWRQWRNKVICSSTNARQIDLGRSHRLTDRQIRTIQKKARTNANQQDLF